MSMSTYILGHRGAMGSTPENTAISFKKALELGADGVEFDVHLTRDEKIVVIHDGRVDRTTDGEGYIKGMTLREVKELDAGSHFGSEFAGERVLTLEETFEIIKGSRKINIELKDGPIHYPGLEEKVLKVIEDFGLRDNIIISSFNHYSIYKVREIDPGINTGLLYMAGLYQPWKYAQRMAVEALHPFYLSFSQEILDQCHRNGIAVNVFGANDKESLKKLIYAGVDIIITDYPENALEIREDFEKKNS